MRVMILIKATKGTEAGALPDGQLLAALGQYNEALVKAGVLLAGEGLHPSSKGVRIHFSGPTRSITHGPFAETGELIAGYWLWQVRSMEEAMEWIRRCPNPTGERSDIEIRQVLEADDAGAGLSLERREPEARLRAETRRGI